MVLEEEQSLLQIYRIISKILQVSDTKNIRRILCKNKVNLNETNKLCSLN